MDHQALIVDTTHHRRMLPQRTARSGSGYRGIKGPLWPLPCEATICRTLVCAGISPNPLHWRAPNLGGAHRNDQQAPQSAVRRRILGLPAYFPGDPVRNIHWRNTALLGRPMVKEFEDSQENMLYIVFDSSQDLGEGRETVLECSIKIATSVSACANERGKSVVVLTGGMPGQWIPWAKLYAGLALLKLDRGPGLPAMIESVPPGAKLLALVSETDVPGVQSLIRRTNQPEGLTVVMLEGFGVTQLPQNPGAKDALQRISASYLRFPKGDLVGILKSLGQTDGAVTTSNIGTVTR